MRNLRRTEEARGVAAALGVTALLGCSVGTDGGGFTSFESAGTPPSTPVSGSTETDSALDPTEGDLDSGTTSDPATATSSGSSPAGPELCNGVDDDNDGTIDEDQPELTCGVGSCEVTVSSCVGGEPQSCTPAQPSPELCNGVDDDCDGTVDEVTPPTCSTACGDGVRACVAGVEQPCDAPAPQPEACNIEDDDCDGQFDEEVPGCRVGVHRSQNPATGEHFYTTDLDEAQCCGFQVEAVDFYRLYGGPQMGLAPFNRCRTPSGAHLYTQSADCEGTTLEGVMGYIATAAGVAGSMPLYRVHLPANGDYFYTTNPAERDNALDVLGYVNEGIAGYVW